jgi:hypothetical protein
MPSSIAAAGNGVNLKHEAAMRINVYEDEIRDRVEATSKCPADAPDVKFVGIQFFVGDDVIHTPGDDDTPAVTFWFHDRARRQLLRNAFTEALRLLDDPSTETGE